MTDTIPPASLPPLDKSETDRNIGPKQGVPQSQNDQVAAKSSSEPEGKVSKLNVGDGPPPGVLETAKNAILGKPIASDRSDTTLLPKILALPIFSSDAISSVAYATQQICLALCAAGLWMPAMAAQYGHYIMLVSAAIVGLLVLIVFSYWQTIHGYPGGGGSYIVSKDNLGTNPGLVAAAALLIDYVLTVSVSIASGIQNLQDVPMFAGLHIEKHLVLYCVVAIVLLTFANLRGTKDSGVLFSFPTYAFIGMSYLMIVLGLFGPLFGWQFHPEYVNQTMPHAAARTAQAFGLVVLMRAFANGCSAMTGTEAVSNGIPAFQAPKSTNAALTLVAMGCILGSIFMGVSWLTVKFHVVYWENGGHTAPAVIDQLSGAIFGKTGGWSWAYLSTQIFTALVLMLAANTSFADFPRLSSILAGDKFMPRQLAFLGDRLAFNNGIILLGLCAAFLIIVKHGSVDLLIPFYAIGVFLAFTLSQAGMVHHWLRLKTPHWQFKAVVNGIGAIATCLVLIDIAAEKFMEGAWIVILVIIALVLSFKLIHREYTSVSEKFAALDYNVSHPQPLTNSVIVLVHSLHVGTRYALDYARSISDHCKAVYVEIDPTTSEAFKNEWKNNVPDIELVVLSSPYRSLTRPFIRYLDEAHIEQPNHRFTVIISEYVIDKWWQPLLFGNTGLRLKLALLARRDIVVANVRYWLDDNRTPGT